jgi:transposase
MKASVHRPTIAKLHLDGVSNVEIANRLGIPGSTVRRVVSQLKSVGHVSEKPKSGQPRSVNTRDNRAKIKKRIEQNDGVSLNQIASSLGISRRTIQNIVKNDFGLKSYRLCRGQYLSDRSKKNRLEKCKKILRQLEIRRI